MKIMKIPEILLVSLLCAGSVSGTSVQNESVSESLTKAVRIEECISYIPDNSSAQIAAEGGQQPSDSSEGAVSVQEEITHSTDKGKSDNNEKGLTPAGNMTLVDDLPSTETGNTEFLTVTTKNNHTFYIVIEKDKTTQNVHFLNQVDERDLMELLSDEERKEIQQAAKETAAPIQIIQTAAPEISNTAEKQNGISVPAVIAIALGTLGIGAGSGYYLFKIRPERRQNYLDENIEFEDEEEYINEDEEPEFEV